MGGCSGDMFFATLVDLGAPLEKIQAEIDSLRLELKVNIETERDCPRGFAGLRLKVKVLKNESWMAPEAVEANLEEQYHAEVMTLEILEPQALPPQEHGLVLKVSNQVQHRNFSDIQKLLANSSLAPRVKERAIKVFRILAEAEGKVHGKPADEVHFHEVGALDSIVDIVGSCCALEHLQIDEIYSTAVGVAQGHVHCAHGQLPLPAPATQHLLIGCPVVQQAEQRELCTPTGAALLKALASFNLPQGEMTPLAIGMGLSHRLPQVAPPFLRATLFKIKEALAHPWIEEQLLWISCDIDDMNPEYAPLLQERMLSAGLLEVNFAPLHMKKGRLGFEIRVLCQPSDRYKALDLLFSHSSTFGCRVESVQRFSLARKMETIPTPWGEVRIKRALGLSHAKVHIEFEDVARICRQENLPWTTVIDYVHKKL